jgi:hypothetical protein
MTGGALVDLTLTEAEVALILDGLSRLRASLTAEVYDTQWDAQRREKARLERLRAKLQAAQEGRI